jgi:hypothetical protein
MEVLLYPFAAVVGVIYYYFLFRAAKWGVKKVIQHPQQSMSLFKFLIDLSRK